ncbi:hypothetical protein FNV43_RR03092 [Rhamnella rubrinervis]|uniref:Cation/H+ exchanger domain-containing protein n=1 Tax=Rhamnella rubrinervis TaxID=2594499 RepID=A0A8K0MNQ6_9ROSA|nr:hypothetical protein FNV43_RR03092 [Rhamnella rubrinervis]
MVCIIVVNRLLMFAFKPLGLPRISAEMLGGFILGPSAIGSTKLGTVLLFPFKTMLTLETLGNLSLIYYMFLVGLEVDMKPVSRAGKKPLSIALIGLVIPIPIGYALHGMMGYQDFSKDPAYGTRNRYGPLFWGIALATTNFPDLARILSTLKLLQSEVGKIALSSAVITDLFSWILLVLSIAIASDTTMYTITTCILFVAICLFVVRPFVAWLVSRTIRDDSDSYNEYHIYFVLAAVPLFGYITDSCGCQSMLGAFMLGVIIPEGELKNTLMEKVEDFVSGLLMPIFFLIIGLRTNTKNLFDGTTSVAVVIMIFFLGFCAKVMSTFIAAVFMNNMSARDGMALGLLMNTKGLLALVVINAGRDLKVLSIQSFNLMVISFWIMTTLVSPILARTYKPTKHLSNYNRRTINSLEEDSEFRILTCIHNPRNISSLVNLLEASNPTRQSPICAIVVHLVENKGRAAAMLIVHDACKTEADENRETPHLHNLNSFENMETRNEGISVEQLTAVSSYSTIHEDICSLAEDKRVSLILVPFHKQSITMEGGMENDAHSPFRDINKHVMDNAQCSVAIFVDHGLSSRHTHGGSKNQSSMQRHFCMFFIGGPDDREALAYALRVSRNPRNSLTVIRIFPREEDHVVDNQSIIGQEEEEEEGDAGLKAVDDECIKEFKLKARNYPSIEFVEEEIDSLDQVLNLIRDLERRSDMFIVGRGKETSSPLTTGLSDWSECPELGPLGDILVSSSCTANSSVLIVQQGTTSSEEKHVAGGELKEHVGRMTWQVPEVEPADFAAFVHRRGRPALGHDDEHH